MRRFLLITLSHVETRNVTQEEVCQRIRQNFSCRSVVVAKETHQEFGMHFHVAVLNDSASRNTATKIIRNLFPEFEGRQCEVKFHRGWNTICAYVIKEDKHPFVWGQYDKEQIFQIGRNAQNKKKNPEVPNLELLEKLNKCNEWLEVYNDPVIAERLLTRYSNFRKIHEDLQILKMQQSSFAERIVSFLDQKGWPQEYAPEEIQEKYVLLDWIACHLAFHRPIKTKQLFLYGEPSTQKTLIIHFLAKALRIYFVSSRINDFAGADNYYDLWVFDEFHESEDQTFANQSETTYANTLLKVLDGQECRLDSKYGKIFNKKRNVPILMIANRLPRRVRQPGPMRERFIRIRFHSQIPDLDEARIVATLWGCIQRRIPRQFAKLENLTRDIFITYNNTPVLISPPIPPIKDEKGRNNNRMLSVVTQQGEGFRGVQVLAKRNDLSHLNTYNRTQTLDYYPYLNIHILEHTLTTPDLSLIQFAFIPILKREGEEKQIEVFKDRREGATFQLVRPTRGEHFIVWPVYATSVETNPESKSQGRTVKLHVWDPFDVHLKGFQYTVDSPGTQGTQEQPKPKSYPQPTGSWKLNLGVPGTDYNGYWDEDD